MMTATKCAVSVFAGVWCLLLAGCETTRVPGGNSGGRIDVNQSTGADEYSREVSTVTLMEFADQVIQDLPARLIAHPFMRDRDYLSALYLGEIINRTQTPTSDFIVTRQIIENGLVNSSLLAEHAMVFTDPARLRAIRSTYTNGEEGGAAGESVFAESTGGGSFAANDVFILDGEMGEISRAGGGQSTYVFTFKVIQASNGAVIFSSQVVSKEVR